MQSWSLRKFVDERGILEARLIWGVSVTAVYTALESNRSIQITLIENEYSVLESKKLGRTTKLKLQNAVRKEGEL